MQRLPFPSPANIRRQTPDEIYGKDAEYLLSNLTKEFEKNARRGAPKQHIEIRRRGNGGNDEAVWIQEHMAYADQRQYSMQYCNQKLATTGWQITGFDFQQVPQYTTGSGWRCPTKAQMNAIIVKMEYVCDDVCAAK